MLPSSLHWFSTKPLDILGTEANLPRTEKTQLYVTGLPWETTNEDLRNHFSKCGKILSMRVPLQYDGKLKGFAFITFDSHNALAVAIGMDGTVITTAKTDQSRKISVRATHE